MRIKKVVVQIVVFVSVSLIFLNAAEAIVQVYQPCDLVDGAFDVTDGEYNINSGRNHAGQPDGSLDIGGNYGQPSNGSSYQRCKGNVALASIDGTVSHLQDTCGDDHKYLRIDGADNISVEYLHVDVSASNTVSDGTVVSVGDVIGTVSNLGCTGDPPFTHIHFTVRDNGTELLYSEWKFEKNEACTPPPSGEWIIETDCNFTSNINIVGSLSIRNNSTVTVAPGVYVDFDFMSSKLTVESGSRLILENSAILY
ncbi:M23 family metallopeptidase [Candidatus Dojkabacteria bacterium]|uniref:M23 family metallopeptidase n=1 Tax=Candidatus Dojkabacteria bacterium TaxID=2099670 RepID=A0A955RJS4_9BACT|nr:M23 family metallopeptidase [Candidatus Dojkabacteria bacterium]